VAFLNTCQWFQTDQVAFFNRFLCSTSLRPEFDDDIGRWGSKLKSREINKDETE